MQATQIVFLTMNGVLILLLLASDLVLEPASIEAPSGLRYAWDEVHKVLDVPIEVTIDKGGRDRGEELFICTLSSSSLWPVGVYWTPVPLGPNRRSSSVVPAQEVCGP